MILSMSEQAWLFLSTVVIGFFIGFLYDIFRVLRRTVPHRAFVVQIEDVLYWGCASVLMFYFMLFRNYGEIRFFSIVGAVVGVVLYFCSLSRVFMSAAVAFIEFMKKVVATAVRILLGPVRLLIRLLTPLAKQMLRLARSSRGKLQYIKRAKSAKARKIRRNIHVMLKKV